MMRTIDDPPSGALLPSCVLFASGISGMAAQWWSIGRVPGAGLTWSTVGGAISLDLAGRCAARVSLRFCVDCPGNQRRGAAA
jgi:hypothetical protein